MLAYFVTAIIYNHNFFTKLTTGHVHFMAKKLHNKSDLDWVWSGGDRDLVPML
jgi:hypothetical protein